MAALPAVLAEQSFAPASVVVSYPLHSDHPHPPLSVLPLSPVPPFPPLQSVQRLEVQSLPAIRPCGDLPLRVCRAAQQAAPPAHRQHQRALHRPTHRRAGAGGASALRHCHVSASLSAVPPSREQGSGPSPLRACRGVRACPLPHCPLLAPCSTCLALLFARLAVAAVAGASLHRASRPVPPALALCAFA